jgi:NAD(P)-dependent dehydrogenase (short-subunit alcohol dehydrogenase family)
VYVTGRSVAGGQTTDGLPGTIDETAELVTQRGGTGIALRCDHTVDDEVKEVFARVRQEQGQLDVLVNNVWGGYEHYESHAFDAPFWEQPLWRWHGMFVAGVRAHYTASHFAAPLMLAQGSGLIICISAGDQQKFLGNVLYDTAKSAVDRMVKGMAHELRPHGVAAIGVYPGFVRTERVLAYHAQHSFDLSNTESPEYVGRAVAALAADAEIMQRSGNIYKAGELARVYGFTDVDGRQVEPFVIPGEPLV